ncbi:MAG: hypothetical protein ACTSU3_07665, partial [Candidatus Thorarchaeota archaeon]
MKKYFNNPWVWGTCLFIITTVPAYFVAIRIITGSWVVVIPPEIDFSTTPALYFFSAVAQTMGALLAISFAVLYTQLSNMSSTSNLQPPIPPTSPKFRKMIKGDPIQEDYRMKNDEYEKKNTQYIQFLLTNVLTIEPMTKCLLYDDLLWNSLYYGLSSIIMSLLFILVIFMYLHTINIIGIIIVIVFSILILESCYISILSLVSFIRNRYALFGNPIKIVSYLTKIVEDEVITKNSRIAIQISKIMLLCNKVLPTLKYHKELHYLAISNIFNSVSKRNLAEGIYELASFPNDIRILINPDYQKITTIQIFEAIIDCVV